MSEINRDYEQLLLQVLANDPSLYKRLNGKRPHVQFNEKDLRDAAHAEVAHSIHEMEKISRRRKPLNPEEKVKQSRDRNREHAKNTRLRKKAYIVKLKEMVDELNKQREVEEFDRRSFADEIIRQYIEEKNAVLLFLTYRARNCQDFNNWAQILDENVEMKLPITPYRYFSKEEISGNQRRLVGIRAVMADAKSLALMVQGIGIGSPTWRDALSRGGGCKLVFHTCKEDTIAVRNLVMCRFIVGIEGNEIIGSHYSCMQPAMLTCKFNDEHKMTHIEIVFDVMSFMQQLQRTAGILPEHSIVPNTLEMALQPSNEVRLIIRASDRYACNHVNLQFTRFTGYSQSDIENEEVFDVVRVNAGERDTLERMLSECCQGNGPSSAVLTLLNLRVNQMGSGTKCFIKVLPLSSVDGGISHLLVTLTDVTTESSDQDSK